MLPPASGTDGNSQAVAPPPSWGVMLLADYEIHLRLLVLITDGVSAKKSTNLNNVLLA